MEEDLAAFRRIIQIAIDELADEALGGNIQRRHHMEGAVACFASIGALIEAEKVVLELFPASEDVEEVSTHDDTHE